MALNNILQVDALAFHFDTRPVFAGLSLTLEPGITWLRGPNGAGKTTLLKLFGGALLPAGGTIRMAGIDCLREPLAYRLHSYYCGGDTPELPWLTVQEFLDLHMALYRSADAQRLNAQLAEFGMLSTLAQAVSTLSLGQHKKLQLALALTLPVRLLLIDEPFNGLDAPALTYLRAQLNVLAALNTVCIVLTSHLEPQVTLVRTLELAAPQ
jgi:ABC-2 type transport system ATP-binding protein